MVQWLGSVYRAYYKRCEPDDITNVFTNYYKLSLNFYTIELILYSQLALPTMSWDSYADSLIGGYCEYHADKMAIVGIETASSWTTPGTETTMNITPEEATTVANIFKDWDLGKAQASFSGGIFLEGNKYRFLRADDDDKLVVGKLKDHGSVILQRAEQCVVIAHTAEGKQQGKVNDGTSKMVEYLKSVGY